MPQSKMEQIKSFLDSSIAFIGIVAALIAVFSWYAGKKVDAAKAIEEELLKARVAEANAEAETAKNEAIKANESIIKTNLKAQELEIEILKQKEKASNLSLELETQKQKTAAAEKELLQLHNKVKQRTLSGTVKDSIVRELRKHAPKSVKIHSRWGDGEARTYAIDIANSFEVAGWHTDKSGIACSAFTGSGLGLLNNNLNDSRISIIINTFKSNSIDIAATQMEHMNMVLFVGTKTIG